MLFLARKNLAEQPFRLAVSVGGVALAVMLILVMWAILQGVLGQAGALVRNTDAQIWVVQKGFTDIAHGFSVVPMSLERRLEALPGVREANPITGARTEVPSEAGKQSLGLIGYDTETGVGGPWRFAGRPAVPKAGEVVLDETFARTGGFEVGERIEVSDRPRRIVALSAGTNQFTNQLAFGEWRDVQKVVRLRRDVNFYALRVSPGRTARVQREIRRRFPSVSPFSQAEFITSNEREIRDGFQPVLVVMVWIAFLVGLIVIGLTMYTATVEKAREYGVLAAIGAGRRQLSGVILRQAGITAALGFLVGCALVFPARWGIQAMSPKTALELPAFLFAAVGAAAVAMALLASWVPIRRLARLDPAAVFRA